MQNATSREAAGFVDGISTRLVELLAPAPDCECSHCLVARMLCKSIRSECSDPYDFFGHLGGVAGSSHAAAASAGSTTGRRSCTSTKLPWASAVTIVKP
jgi:hypothetical protein